MATIQVAGYAPVNGIKMYYEVWGESGMPLVLIHGGGSTIETSFGNILPYFAAYGKVIAVELQAHGRTSDRNVPESFEQDADDVAGLLNYLKIAKANFFGFSNGGTTSLQIAIRHPELVNKIINLAGAYKRDGFIPGFFEGFKNVTLAHMPLPLRTAFLKVRPDQNALQNMFEKDVARMVKFKDIADDLMRAIKAKVLIMTGDQDVMPCEHAVKMSQLIPGARLAILPGAHGACIGEAGTVKAGSRQPEITAILVEEFLKE
ncbi:alpha/beta fold hydrolase [Mucilaginibacter gotjawali]|uniref:Pimeloyl-ACP methyl ester carboxylesterase n=2 Tax=Mucilaginibacter gotjawali TaxID=1550579 RepID=A0A839SMZ6_9SPHI|nr:alpha/beta hydrolase [Mucilaginibacter gotjawali]MBB3058604.1 pimeloyl-ACP methyl ester carboxylesterase [Mucilaginibacter gotjawali]BAU52429.1 Non-heme chloroperoxidase [Mucilaginibacter gotjawali]